MDRAAHLGLAIGFGALAVMGLFEGHRDLMEATAAGLSAYYFYRFWASP